MGVGLFNGQLKTIYFRKKKKLCFSISQISLLVNQNYQHFEKYTDQLLVRITISKGNLIYVKHITPWNAFFFKMFLYNLDI